MGNRQKEHNLPMLSACYEYYNSCLLWEGIDDTLQEERVPLLAKAGGGRLGCGNGFGDGKGLPCKKYDSNLDSSIRLRGANMTREWQVIFEINTN